MSIINPLKFNCECCLYSCSNKKDFNKHLVTNKHQNKIGNGIKFRLVPHVKYTCELCDYVCSNKKDFNKHILTQKHATNTKNSINPPEILHKNPTNGYTCDLCNYNCKYKREYNKHVSTNKHARNTANHAPIEAPLVDSSEDLKKMVIACIQTQDFLQTMITTLAENQKNQNENQKNQLEFQNENQKNQLEFQNKLIEALPTLGTTNITQNNTFNLNTYLTIDCKDAETLGETKKRLKDYVLGLDTNTFIEHAAQSSSNAILEKVIRGFYRTIEPCKRSIQTVDVARGKSYVKHAEETGFELDEEGNAAGAIANSAGHHSVNHCIKYKKVMQNPDHSWKKESIGCEYNNNVDSKINNMWRYTDANTTMAKKIIGTATKIDKTCK